LAGSANLTFSGTALTVPTITSPSATALTIQSAGTTAVTVDTSQNVGIGTSSPSTYGKLVSVSGDNATTFAAVGATNMLRVQGYNATYAGTLIESVNLAQNANTPLFINGSQTLFAISGSEKMRIDTSGNVGIGTTSPSNFASKLVVGTSDNTNGVIASAVTALVRIGGYSSGKSAGYIEALNTAQSAFSPLWFGGSILQFATSGSEAMRIDTSGNLLVGYTSSNGAYKLQVNSQIFATSSTIATSDARYKQNVQTLNGALSIVKALRPVSFNWKKHPVHAFDTESTTVGFLAQEVQQVLADKLYLNSIIKKNECIIEPEVKDKNGDVTTAAVTEEFLGIAEGNMIAILTSALQELSAKVAALEANATKVA
jgi:hypothetical protein